MPGPESPVPSSEMCDCLKVMTLLRPPLRPLICIVGLHYLCLKVDVNIQANNACKAPDAMSGI